MMFLLLALALLTNAQLNLDLSLVGGARSQLAGALTADGQVVFAGGVGGLLTTLFNTVDVVATVDNAVTPGKALTSSRYALAAATSANFSIFAGGLTAATSFSADVDVYSAVDGTWNATTLAIARAHHAVASTADFVYVAGGQVAANVYTDSVEVFVSATGEIDASLNFTLSLARGFLASATLDTSVFFAGGVSFNGTAEVSAVVDVYDSTSGNLTVYELSEARQQIAAVAVGTQVFFAGGASTATATPTASAVVDIWDSTTGQFNTTALSVARWGVRAVVVGELVIFHGGYTAANVASRVVDIFNVTAQAWEVPTLLARARADFSAVAVDNKVYIAGGVSGGLSALINGAGSLEVLDFSPSNNTDTPTPTPPSAPTNLTVTVVTFASARAQLAATVAGSGELLIAGGVGATIASNAISSIDVNAVGSVAVELTQVLGLARLGLKAETAANVSVFAGGALLSLVPQTRVDIYYAVNNTWATANLATARVYHASAVVGSKIYFAGGLSVAAFVDTIEVYDAELGTWTVLTAKLSVARGYLTASVVGDFIVFAGGRSGLVATAVLSDVVDVLNTVTGEITSSVTLSVARAQLASAVVGDLVLFGGGVQASLTASVVVDVYNVTAGAFVTTNAALSVGRWALEAVTVGTDVFFVGGFDGTDAYATVDIWNSVTDVWTVAELTFPRYNFAATVDASGTAYFCGGQNSLGFLASVEVYAGGDNFETPTPTPTGPETPTPTPVVTPTPTPGQTPTPTPSNGNCVQDCETTFTSAQDSWNQVSTDFTVRCGAWSTRLTCLAACNDDTSLNAATDSCTQSGPVNDFCPCGRDNFGFNAGAAVAYIGANVNVFVARFNALTGVVASPTGGSSATTIVVNTDQNSLSNTFTFDDSVQIQGQSATVELISVEWSIDFGIFFGTSPNNFVVSQSKKRAEQQGSLSVSVNDNTSPSGVSQLSISFAFVLVTFLLHVLF